MSSSSSSVLRPPTAGTVTPSIWQLLYSDALVSIFPFLELAALAKGSRVCKAWGQAAIKVPYGSGSSGATYSPQSSVAELEPFFRSPLRHHVRVLSLVRLKGLVHAHLQQVAEQLPRLRSLQHFASDPTGRVHGETRYTRGTYSPHLTSLELGVFPYATAMAECQSSVLDPLASAVGLTSLTVVCSFTPGMSLSLAPLLQLQHLIELRFRSVRSDFDVCFEQGHFDLIRRLPHLRILGPNCGRPMRVEILALFCDRAPGSPAPVLPALEEFDLAHTTLTVAHLQVLSTVPTLRRLRPQRISADALTSLVNLPQLDTLSIHPSPSSSGLAMALDPAWHTPFNESFVTALCVGLNGLSKLTVLTLHSVPLAALSTILSSTPRLHELSLLDLSIVDGECGSLDCFASVPMLESLRISLAPVGATVASSKFSVAELLASLRRHTTQLRSLYLNLPRAQVHPPASEDAAALVAALPTLTECRIEHNI